MYKNKKNLNTKCAKNKKIKKLKNLNTKCAKLQKQWNL